MPHASPEEEKLSRNFGSRSMAPLRGAIGRRVLEEGRPAKPDFPTSCLSVQPWFM
jgi:hypothetical protein